MTPSLSPDVLIAIVLAPLAGSLIAGLAGRRIGRAGAHWVTIIGVAIAFGLSTQVLLDVNAGARFNATVYEWMTVGRLQMVIGFLIDPLTAIMMCVVSFVSLMVHIYTIGYMADDDTSPGGYQRFFSYISLFTFSMLVLVMSNNFLQLFFGWEAVGLVSYLLIGYYYRKPSAIFANFKAFMVNRVGDFGFILGIALIAAYAGTLDYAQAFARAPELARYTMPGSDWMLITVICLCLFVGAMGKSAQFPLHVWLPDSMEGPTPISALIHAATMVTAGIFMVARMSPLFELSDTALAVVMLLGAITALFMGILGVVQNDIKRVVAYSTLSQLGYMTVALGASAYSVAVFHLTTHAFFKALLFLAAGSVIIGMHHDQDMRNMGGLRKYMPITWITTLLGTMALIAVPFFAGFYSKDSIIEAVHFSNLPGAGFAYFAVTASVFVTALYSFRLYFLVFHGEERFRDKPFPGEHDHPDEHGHVHQHEPHESPWVVTLPLVLLAIASVGIGYVLIQPMLYGGFFGESIVVLAQHPAMAEMAREFRGALGMALHALSTLPFWLMLAGAAAAWVLYQWRTDWPARLRARFGPLYRLLDNKYYLDWINENLIAAATRGVGIGLWKGGDVGVIDGLINGSAAATGGAAGLLRRIQSGFLYWYALVMVLGVFALLTWQLWPHLARLAGG